MDAESDNHRVDLFRRVCFWLLARFSVLNDRENMDMSDRDIQEVTDKLEVVSHGAYAHTIRQIICYLRRCTDRSGRYLEVHEQARLACNSENFFKLHDFWMKF